MAQDMKLSGDERLMIIDSLIDELNKYPLQVRTCHDSIISNVVPLSSHSYRLLGSDILRRTQQQNLLQKLEGLQQQPLSSEDASPPFRYFSDNIRCFRCKKLGHYNTACLDQYSCLFCLSSEHPTENCSQKTVCYQCYQYGHILNECHVSGGQSCLNCKRRHHRKCGFLTKGIEPVKQMFNTEYLFADPNIRCMRCFEFGHLLCNPSRENHNK